LTAYFRVTTPNFIAFIGFLHTYDSGIVGLNNFFIRSNDSFDLHSEPFKLSDFFVGVANREKNVCRKVVPF